MLTPYPEVMSERDTLEAILTGRSIARYGDGELRVALGSRCISQEADKSLAIELRSILADAQKSLLVGIPNIKSATPKPEAWAHYGNDNYTRLYKQKAYASSFITRPESAPWIDVPEYWQRVKDIWRGKHVVFIAGDPDRSLRLEDIAPEAASVKTISAPPKNAFADVKRIEEEINGHNGPIIMCLGCAATVLASRLDRKGLWGMDLGHIGLFMRHQGIYRIALDALCSHKYRRELNKMHAAQKWGCSGAGHAEFIRPILERVRVMAGVETTDDVTILDYGCGRGTLKTALDRRVQEYDPGIKGKDGLPKPADVVVCTDVLEHVEPRAVSSVIDHLFNLTGYIAYVNVATREANAVLPDGRNAHLVVKDANWWTKQMERKGWTLENIEVKGSRAVTFTIVKDRP